MVWKVRFAMAEIRSDEAHGDSCDTTAGAGATKPTFASFDLALSSAQQALIPECVPCAPTSLVKGSRRRRGLRSGLVISGVAICMG